MLGSPVRVWAGLQKSLDFRNKILDLWYKNQESLIKNHYVHKERDLKEILEVEILIFLEFGI